jgi:hypothetical protein
MQGWCHPRVCRETDRTEYDTEPNRTECDSSCECVNRPTEPNRLTDTGKHTFFVKRWGSDRPSDSPPDRPCDQQHGNGSVDLLPCCWQYINRSMLREARGRLIGGSGGRGGAPQDKTIHLKLCAIIETHKGSPKQIRNKYRNTLSHIKSSEIIQNLSICVWICIWICICICICVWIWLLICIHPDLDLDLYLFLHLHLDLELDVDLQWIWTWI